MVGAGSAFVLWAAVYGIVSQAGGTVTLDSELGRGTSVVVDLPTRDPLYPTGAPAAVSA